MAVRRSPLDPRAGCYLLIRPADSDRRALAGLHGPVAIDELSRQSGLATAMVATVLLELELARRLERHDGGRVSGN